MTAIISDIAITSPERNAEEEYACKSGVLFPGLIYGIAGNSYQAIRFLEQYRDIYMYEPKNLVERWQEFVEHVKLYEYPTSNPSSREYFEILLSVREGVFSKLYRLYSGYGLQECPQDAQGGFYYAGSGHLKLTDYMREWVVENVARVKVELIGYHGWSEDAASLIIPYLTCQLLSDKTLGYESKILDSVGVGGAFHFVYQTAEGDFFQRPTWLVHDEYNAPETSGVVYWSRISYTRHGLYFNTPPKHKFSQFLLGFPVPLPNYRRQSKIERIMEDVSVDLVNQPFYYYCGLGRLDSDKRKATGFIVREDGKYNDLFDESGNFRIDFERVGVYTIVGTPKRL